MQTLPARITDNDRRTLKLSLPPRVSYRLRWLGSVQVGSQSRKFLTTGLAPLTSEERAFIEGRIDALVDEVVPQDGDDDLKIALLSEMVIALSGAKGAQEDSQIKMGVYLRTLSATPAWAVHAALERWYTGKGLPDGIAKSSLGWPPAPAVLLELAEGELAPYANTITDLRVLLDVKPLDETLMDQPK